MKVWGVASEDVGNRADFCSCKICIHAIPSVRSLPPSPMDGFTQHLNSIVHRSLAMVNYLG